MNNYEYYIGGSLPIHATTYVKRQADRDLYQGWKNGDFCYLWLWREIVAIAILIQYLLPRLG